jgi:hypothetical protein
MSGQPVFMQIIGTYAQYASQICIKTASSQTLSRGAEFSDKLLAFARILCQGECTNNKVKG